jgi:hypothetical protein
MSMNNQINVQIPKTVLDDVNQKLQECKVALAPYLQGLTPTKNNPSLKWETKP